MAIDYKEKSKQRLIHLNKQRSKKKIEEYNNSPSVCKNCDKLLPYNKRNNKFCNHSCAASFNNIGVSRNVTEGKWIIKNCLNCGVKTDNEKYCSHKCQKEYDWSLRKKEIEDLGEITSYHCGKKYLLETRGDRCEICGINEWNDKKLSLIMDHIDGNPYNNFLNNLRLICPNCDSLLPTYKSKNRGNGRHNRRLRYKKGKSY